MMALRKPAVAEIVVGAEPRVNLMPPAEYVRRERDRTLRRWGWGLVAALAVVATVAAGSLTLTWTMNQQLTAEQQRTTGLVGELGSMRDISTAIRSQQELQTFRSQAMAADVSWVKLSSEVSGVLPQGVVLTGFDLAAGGVPAAGDAKTQVGLIGTLTLTSPVALEMAQVIRALRTVPGVSAADGTQLKAQDDAKATGPYTYTVTVTFDQSVYTGRYAKKGGN